MRTPRPIAARTGDLRSWAAAAHRGARGSMATSGCGVTAVAGEVATVPDR